MWIELRGERKLLRVGSYVEGGHSGGGWSRVSAVMDQKAVLSAERGPWAHPPTQNCCGAATHLAGALVILSHFLLFSWQQHFSFILLCLCETLAGLIALCCRHPVTESPKPPFTSLYKYFRTSIVGTIDGGFFDAIFFYRLIFYP